MAQLSIAAAAKLVGKDRKTLYRLVKEGRLSATLCDSGMRQVETSELLRLFGDFKQITEEGCDSSDCRATVSLPQHETSFATGETARISLLEAELRHAKELLEVKDSQIQDLRQSILLIDARRQPVVVQKRTFWPWSRNK